MIKIPLPLPSREVLERQYNAASREYEVIMSLLVGRLQSHLDEHHINATIRYRVKSFGSWYTKLINTAVAGKESSELTLTDVMGMRIICPFLEEVRIVCDLLNEFFTVNEMDIKGEDYPYQFFGYESIHFLIHIPQDLLEDRNFSSSITVSTECEVQVRTILQEAWAEVEHELVYKSDFTPMDEPLKRKLAALNANLTLSDIMFQEIRGYQKSLHSELKKRRKEFYERIHSLQEDEDQEVPAPRGTENLSSEETVDALLLKGLLAHNDKRYGEAVEVYTKILSRTDRRDIRTVIFLHRGMACFSAGREEEALSDFNSALEQDPANGKARYYRAVYTRLNGHFNDAFSDLALCLEKEPYNLEYITARGETHQAAGHLVDARKDYLKALNIDPDFKPARRLLKALDGE